MTENSDDIYRVGVLIGQIKAIEEHEANGRMGIAGGVTISVFVWPMVIPTMGLVIYCYKQHNKYLKLSKELKHILENTESEEARTMADQFLNAPPEPCSCMDDVGHVCDQCNDPYSVDWGGFDFADM